MESAKSFLSGAFGGSLVVVLGHPMDTIKVRLMTSDGRYRGTWDCLQKSVQRFGLRRGLYAGMAVPMLTVAPVYATYFWAFDEGKRLFCQMSGQPPRGEEPLPLAGNVFAGAFSAVLGTLAMIPGDLVKVQLQVENAKPVAERRFVGPVACIRRIVANEGALGLYRGAGVTMCREVPATIVYYSLYESVKRPIHSWMGRGWEHASIVLSGGIAGSVYTVVSLPADVVKSRLQSQPKERFPDGARQVARELFHTSGLAGF
ncbi:hypothetical protein BASA81_003656 [Batrachochytrium salamandrivorans]|nr:hypothetical protein BASA81_003656 [Batrachochytrium salamandrivorans]